MIDLHKHNKCSCPLALLTLVHYNPIDLKLFYFSFKQIKIYHLFDLKSNIRINVS